MALIEVDGCVFDEEQLASSHGFEMLDAVDREAFVNHLHLSGADPILAANRVISSWVTEMRSRWPGRVFRIYKHVDSNEVIIRFHSVRPDLANWHDQGLDPVEVITVTGGTDDIGVGS
jgi:hypothetical protein